MPATLARLVQVRSRLAGEVLAYLDALARRAAELPPYYPPALRHVAADEPPFDAVRQKVQVVEDRTAFERWGAEERERARAAGDEDAAVPAPPPPIPWDERAGERFKRAIILGDPGFGKTWLLRYEARRLARQAARQLRDYAIPLDDLVLPFFLRLSDLNRSDDPLEDALVRLVGQGRSAAFAQFIRDTLTTGRCVLLLDGWDEVPVETPPLGQPIRYRPGFRQRLGQRLEVFARASHRLLLTSRIVGYTGSPIPDAQELELLAFDTPQIEAFARVWFGGDAATAERFLATLRDTPQVHGLARIPLMLTLICRAYLEGQLTFPTRRADLYDRCLRGLLRDWKEEKEQREIGVAWVEATLELLETVAEALFMEGYEQFSESQVHEAVRPQLARLDPSHELYVYGWSAAKLIDQLKRDGVFIRAGKHHNAPLLFLHRTFHEYLVASALARRADREGWGAIAALVDKRAWLPTWQEVVILLAGKLKDPTPLLGMLANPDPTPTNPHGDDLFRHRLALAALCLPELTSESRSKCQALVDRITGEAFSLWWRHWLEGTAAIVPHLTRALPALGRIGAPWALEALLALARDENVRWRVMEALERMGDPRAVEVLLALARDESASVRWEAAWALGRIGDARALERLLALTQDAEGWVRRAAAVALGEIGDARALERLQAQAGIRLFANAEFRRVTDLARDG